MCRNKAILPLFEQYLIKKQILFISGGPSSLFNEKQIYFIKLWERLRLGYKIKASKLKELYREYLPTGDVVARGSKNLIESMPDSEMFNKDTVFKLPETTKKILLKAEQENKFDKATDIEVNTIHSSKGREADNVVVLPDMTTTSYYAYQKDPDNEHRVFYVACTRAKQKLFIHTPVTSRYYTLP